MLFVQEIHLYWEKSVNYASFANARRAVKFFPVTFDINNISEEILFNRVLAKQTEDKLIVLSEKTSVLGESAFFSGKFNSDLFDRRIYVKHADGGYEICYTSNEQRGFLKTAFSLTNGQNGRLVYNHRSSDSDNPSWIYNLKTFNFVCNGKDAFKPKLFYIKQPDFLFDDLKMLGYCGND